MSDSLQHASGRADVSRGLIIPVASGTSNANGLQAKPVGQSLRLGSGTWEIFAARVNDGNLGLGKQPGPPGAPDALWPFGLAIIHGVGAAMWTEAFPMRASGMRLRRTGDYLQVQLFIGPGNTVFEDEQVLISGAQPIVRTEDAWLTTVVANSQGTALHSVPAGAYLSQVQSDGQVVIDWQDAAGTTIATVAAFPSFGPNLVVPLDAAFANLTITGGGASASLMGWKVVG